MSFLPYKYQFEMVYQQQETQSVPAPLSERRSDKVSILSDAERVARIMTIVVFFLDLLINDSYI